MKKIYFIFGYYVSNWSEYHEDGSFQLKGIVEINQFDSISIIENDIIEKLKKKIKSKKLKKYLEFGGSGDLGGSSTKFHSEFFCEKGNSELTQELNQRLEKRLGEVFDLEYKSI